MAPVRSDAQREKEKLYQRERRAAEKEDKERQKKSNRERQQKCRANKQKKNEEVSARFLSCRSKERL